MWSWRDRRSANQNCVVQMGGSDQWGNILNGRELAAKLHKLDVHAVTTNLLLDAKGNKFGKSAVGLEGGSHKGEPPPGRPDPTPSVPDQPA